MTQLAYRYPAAALPDPYPFLMILNDPEDKICDFCNFSQLLDGPHADPSVVRPTGPNQMVNRMQNPAGTTLISVNYIITKTC